MRWKDEELDRELGTFKKLLERKGLDHPAPLATLFHFSRKQACKQAGRESGRQAGSRQQAGSQSAISLSLMFINSSLSLQATSRNSSCCKVWEYCLVQASQYMASNSELRTTTAQYSDSHSGWHIFVFFHCFAFHCF